ncbi:MAG: class I SAM-dependent methyltransferase [Proteobacteria bacterium]|nr:class I SAM-dependent methyltransferase [Pseudomonadota bacterium]
MPRLPSLALSLAVAASLGLATTALADPPAATATKPDPALAAAIASSGRDARFIARDSARHPLEELTFFGLKPQMTVVELWPGGGYWTEILGPYLKKEGRYFVALPSPGNAEEDSGVTRWRAKVAAQQERLGTIHETTLGPGHFEIAPAGSADLVLTFRNIHNWMEAGYAEDVMAAAYKALKPGGILGIEGHRGRTDKPQDPKAEDGYVREDYAIALAKKAGFELAGSSEIDANPKDTKDWPKGVWTLPPTLEMGDKDRAKYLAIGEADNFVLKFRKPAR